MMDTPTKRKLSPISPQFMKPSDLFRKRKERKTSKVSPSKISPSKTLYSPLKCLQNYDNCSNIVSPQKTFSPFRQKRTPKRNQIRNSFPIVKKLSSTPPKGKRKLNFQTISDKNVLNFDENANIESANCSANFPLNRDSKQDLIDWTLKTRLRFVSDKAFAFRGSFRATEESAGISGFVRCLTSKANIDTDSLSNQSNQDSMDTSFASQLHKQCLIWSHPSLPWLTLFPRNESHMKPGAPLSSKAPTFSIIPNTPLADALHTDWCKSLKSLYQLLKAKHCPYFYVCANTFTILFRASGVADSDDIHVFVTPTSTGFRKLLTDEGINFSLPFCDNKNTTNSEDNTTSGYHSINIPPILSSNDQKNIADNCDVGDDNEESPHVWLESLGLSQQDFPSLQSKRKNRSTDNAVSKVKSLVLIKGMANTQLFLNFLLNARICVANSGPLSGIPPTLLSPTAFHGSTLQSLKVKQTVSEISENQSYNCLEVSGPILPNCMNGLINLMKETHDSFKASFATYEPTQAFSSVMVSKEPNVTSRAFAIENLKDCGLDKQFLSNVCSDDCRASEPINKLIVKNSIVLYNQNF